MDHGHSEQLFMHLGRLGKPSIGHLLHLKRLIHWCIVALKPYLELELMEYALLQQLHILMLHEQFLWFITVHAQ
jgi:hypothetical protein